MKSTRKAPGADANENSSTVDSASFTKGSGLSALCDTSYPYVILNIIAPVVLDSTSEKTY